MASYSTLWVSAPTEILRRQVSDQREKLMRVRYSVITLLLVCPAVAAVVGLLVGPPMRERANAKRLTEYGWEAHWDYEFWKEDGSAMGADAERSAGKRMSDWLFGRVRTLKRIQRDRIAPKEMELVGLFSEATFVDLSQCDLSSSDLSGLERLGRLRSLKLWHSVIADDQLCALMPRMDDLQFLDITGTDVSDESVDTIAACKSLRRITIIETNIGREGWERLKSLLPECEVRHY